MFLAAGTAAAASVAGAGMPNAVAGDALQVEPWMKIPGAGFVGYGQPSTFESKVVRTFASLPGTTGTGGRTHAASFARWYDHAEWLALRAFS
jgi:sulfane dehydrogenase subunit SoxC